MYAYLQSQCKKTNYASEEKIKSKTLEQICSKPDTK